VGKVTILSPADFPGMLGEFEQEIDIRFVSWDDDS